MSPLADVGRLKLVLLLEPALADRREDDLPVLDREVLRDDGPEAFPSIGDDDKTGEVGLLFGALNLLLKSRLGMSVGHS
jgi:hypothetical protein